MKKNLLIYLTFIGLAVFLAGCEKDGEIVTISASPVAPTLTTIPDLALERTNGNDVLEFIGTPIDPGFQASATYYLEACAAGTAFADPVVIWSGVQNESMKITVSDLNGILLKKFPADATTSLDFRVRAVLVVDAGTGAPGTGNTPFSYASALKNASVTLYGLPRLDLVGSGMDQKIESALGDGNYTGYVKLEIANPFTLLDPDANIAYGGSAKVLQTNGPAFIPEFDSWHKMTVNVNDMTYDLDQFAVGLIGSATPNGWSAPDSKMDYDAAGGFWHITLDLLVGYVKFRANDVWDAGINLGIGDDSHPEYSLSNLWNNGSSKDIPIDAAGNYTIRLTIGTSTYSATITKN
jgi:starch-binding outer membrane protein SusE/F